MILLFLNHNQKLLHSYFYHECKIITHVNRFRFYRRPRRYRLAQERPQLRWMRPSMGMPQTDSSAITALATGTTRAPAGITINRAGARYRRAARRNITIRWRTTISWSTIPSRICKRLVTPAIMEGIPINNNHNQRLRLRITGVPSITRTLCWLMSRTIIRGTAALSMNIFPWMVTAITWMATLMEQARPTPNTHCSSLRPNTLGTSK